MDKVGGRGMTEITIHLAEQSYNNRTRQDYQDNNRTRQDYQDNVWLHPRGGTSAAGGCRQRHPCTAISNDWGCHGMRSRIAWGERPSDRYDGTGFDWHRSIYHQLTGAVC